MKKIATYAYALISILVLLVSLYFYSIIRSYLGVKKIELLGNTPSVVEHLKTSEGKLPFSFAFISDTENTDISKFLIKTLLDEKVNFLVFVGDFANDSIVPEHKLFMQVMAEIRPAVPVFLAVGNHDIEPEIGQVRNNGFLRKDFESLYGPINFSFVYNKCLFIFIANIDQEDKISCDYLEKILSERNKDIKHTFVFCHTPLRVVLNKIMPGRKWTGRLDEIVRKYRVDYVISGDYHRHLELTGNNGIQYIVSGSGGSHYHGETSLGKFYSGTKVTVRDDSIETEIIVRTNKITLTDNSIRHCFYNEVMPYLESKILLVNVVLLVVIINTLLSVYYFIKSVQI